MYATHGNIFHSKEIIVAHVRTHVIVGRDTARGNTKNGYVEKSLLTIAEHWSSQSDLPTSYSFFGGAPGSREIVRLISGKDSAPRLLCIYSCGAHEEALEEFVLFVRIPSGWHFSRGIVISRDGNIMHQGSEDTSGVVTHGAECLDGFADFLWNQQAQQIQSAP